MDLAERRLAQRDNMRRWRAANPDRDRENNARYRANHPELCRARTAEWRKRNKPHAAQAMRKWRLANRKHHAAYQIANRLNHLERYLLDNAKRRARKRGIEFTITVNDIEIPEVCPLLGVPLAAHHGSHGPTPYSPSVDRIDPRRGYVPGNVWVVSHRANSIKNNATVEELEALVVALRKRIDSA